MKRKQLKIAILGMGATGLAISAHILRRGNTFTAIETRSDKPKNSTYEVVWNDEKPQTVSFVHTLLREIDHSPTFLLVCTRAQSLLTAINSLTDSALRNTPVVIASNGIGLFTADSAPILHEGPCIRAAMYFGAAWDTAPNVVRCYGEPKLTLGADSAFEIRDAIAADLYSLGFKIAIRESARAVEWEKLPLNLVVNLIATAANLPNGCILSDQTLLKDAAKILCEFREVATASGVTVSKDLESTVFASIESVRSNTNSTLLDLRRGRQLELPYIAGNFLAVAKKFGIDSPTVANYYERILKEAKYNAL